MRTRLSLGLLLVFGWFPPTGMAAAASTVTNRAHYLQYEPAIRAFEAADILHPPPRNAVLFIGSSSIRKWVNAPRQFPNQAIINRGFGGSHLADSVAFADRIVIPYAPKLIVLYAGDNDLAAGLTAPQVFADFKQFASQVHARLPQTVIAFLAIKPSPSRIQFLPQCREANRLIREFSANQKRLIYVDVFTPMLDAVGKPRGELFLSDRLHLNAVGYQLWAGILKPVLDEFAPSPAPQPQ